MLRYDRNPEQQVSSASRTDFLHGMFGPGTHGAGGFLTALALGILLGRRGQRGRK